MKGSRITTKRSCPNHSAAFKAKVAPAAFMGDEIFAQLATRFDVHPNQIVQWNGQLLERAADLLNGAGPDIKALNAKIGQLALENDISRRARTASQIEQEAVLDPGLGNIAPPSTGQ